MSRFSPMDVIQEVKIRPGIYDRKSLEPPRAERRQQLWVEVAESVTPAEEWANFSQKEKEIRISEVTNKWKNLRDHFYREVKLVESGHSNKKRKYVYYDDMEFVRPYIGYKSAPKNKLKYEVLECTTEDYKVNDSDIDMDAFLKLNDDDSNGFSKIETVNEAPSPKKVKKSINKRNINSKRPSISMQEEIKNFDLLRKKDGGKNPTFKIRESDISFCLSLVQHLRELNGARKLSAKIDILKVLHKNLDEIEQNEKKAKNSEDTDDEFFYTIHDPLSGRRNN